MLDSLAKPRLSAASFRAGWEAAVENAGNPLATLEQALREHLEP